MLIYKNDGRLNKIVLKKKAKEWNAIHFPETKGVYAVYPWKESPHVLEELALLKSSSTWTKLLVNVGYGP
jgi:hypothetical protein